MNKWWLSRVLDPLVFGDYPPEMRQYHRSELPRFSTEETEYMKGSIDFIGLNHYSTLYAKDCIHSPCVSGGDHFIRGFAFTTGERDGTLIGETVIPFLAPFHILLLEVPVLYTCWLLLLKSVEVYELKSINACFSSIYRPVLVYQTQKELNYSVVQYRD